MAERQVSVRLSVIDGGKVKAELKSVGDEGERALRRIGEATTPANAGLRVVNAVASDARGRLDAMAANAGIAGVAALIAQGRSEVEAADAARVGGRAAQDERRREALKGIVEEIDKAGRAYESPPEKIQRVRAEEERRREQIRRPMRARSPRRVPKWRRARKPPSRKRPTPARASAARSTAISRT